MFSFQIKNNFIDMSKRVTRVTLFLVIIICKKFSKIDFRNKIKSAISKILFLCYLPAKISFYLNIAY